MKKFYQPTLLILTDNFYRSEHLDGFVLVFAGQTDKSDIEDLRPISGQTLRYILLYLPHLMVLVFQYEMALTEMHPY